jgi:hypothetical protein
MVKVGCQRNPYFLSSCYQINSKLGEKVGYRLPLSWWILGADQFWPSWVSLWIEHCLLQGQILKSKVPYLVAPHIKTLDECFRNQLKFWRYDIIILKLMEPYRAVPQMKALDEWFSNKQKCWRYDFCLFVFWFFVCLFIAAQAIFQLSGGYHDYR